ncbi:hypothetical protein Vadar_024973 [Vaccinium darrowii]|uniref:Uncharacterized protein n=1 Tax=Vaccinium darrowii TaxID=229202 RepID=A0ACB7XU67_9ERIC|nr:hypothetical protein Vadar_024973 [Vaccinium darrowii]
MTSPPSRRTSSSSSAVNYPFPSEVNVANFVPIKLGAPSDSDYSVWKQLMLNLIESHQLEGFVDGTIQPPPFPLEEHKLEEYRSWKRSDGLVRGWVFVTVTEEILPQLVNYTTAREAWIAIEESVTPSAPPLPQSISESESEDEWRTITASRYLPLYRATRTGDWENAAKFLDQKPEAVRDAITYYSETALMLAVRSSKRNDFVKKLMQRMTPEDVARQDTSGQTALQKAVTSGNNVAAKWLVEKNPQLPNIETKDGEELAVHYAAQRGNREMVEYLLEVTKPDGDPNPFEGKLGAGLLTALVAGELYDIASTFLRRYPTLASMNPNPLWEISCRHTSFRSRTRLNFFQRLIYSGVPLKLERNANKLVGRDIENSADGVVSPLGYVSQKLHAMFWDVAEKLVPTIKSVRETKLKHHQALKFLKHLCEEVVKSELPNAGDIFRKALFSAATLGICEIVEEILDVFPSGIYFTYQRQRTLFQLAIENRQENVFNLIYQMDENHDHFLWRRDKFQNNALHTAGNFASRQQISLQANVAGAALQMQRELQWFKVIVYYYSDPLEHVCTSPILSMLTK